MKKSSPRPLCPSTAKKSTETLPSREAAIAKLVIKSGLRAGSGSRCIPQR